MQKILMVQKTYDQDKNPIMDFSLIELNRLEALQYLSKKLISIREACAMMALSRSQVYKQLAEYLKYGRTAVRSKIRGKPSNRAYASSFRERVLKIIENCYSDHGPTLISEMLSEDGILVSSETVRQWMIKAKLWIQDRVLRRQIHQPRKRNPAYGGLVQIDGSKHDWFEDRGPKSTLMVYVDDATSRLQLLRFVPAETKQAYYQCTEDYIERHGRPITFLTDKPKGIYSSKNETGFSLGLKELNIIHSVAHSAQSKGRVERVHRTLQDRLVKALRMENISDIKTANAWVDRFVERYNRKFAKPALSDENMHRTLSQNINIGNHLCDRASRKISRSLTFNYAGDRFVIVDPSSFGHFARKRMDFCISKSGMPILTQDGKKIVPLERI